MNVEEAEKELKRMIKKEERSGSVGRTEGKPPASGSRFCTTCSACEYP